MEKDGTLFFPRCNFLHAIVTLALNAIRNNWDILCPVRKLCKMYEFMNFDRDPWRVPILVLYISKQDYYFKL